MARGRGTPCENQVGIQVGIQVKTENETTSWLEKRGVQAVCGDGGNGSSTVGDVYGDDVARQGVE